MTPHDNWTEQHYRRSSAAYGREAGWSECGGTTRLTAFSWAMIGFGVALISIGGYVDLRGYTHALPEGLTIHGVIYK